MMRFKSLRKKEKTEDNPEARKISFQIFDQNEDGQINGGELFLFFKFATFYKSMLKGAVHLLYQRNLDFDLKVQT